MATYPNPLTTTFMDKAIKERPTKEAIKQSYIGLSILPMKDVPDYELTWDIIKHQNHLAGVYSHTGVPIPGDDPDFKQVMADVINIMAARVMDDQSVMVLRDPGEPSLRSNIVNSAKQKAMKQLANKIASADDEVEAVIEYLIMQSLQGSITWPPKDDDGNAIANTPAYWGDVSFTLSLGFRSAYTQNISTLAGWDGRSGGGYNWKHANADPMLDLEVLDGLFTKTSGLSMDGAKIIMSRSVLSYMATRPNVINWFKGTDSGIKYIPVHELKDYIKLKTGFNIQTYDARWTYATPTKSASGQTENLVHFLKEGKMLVIPKGALGRDIAYFATAPTSGADDSYKPGKYTWAEKLKKPPWKWEVGVGIKGFPILKSVREIGVFDVFN